MTPKRLAIHDIRFEAKDAEIFRIPDTKTRLDTLQHYFFPRLEALLRDTVDLIQDVYDVNPYERMTVTARPRHRREGWRFLDSGVVYMGLTGQRKTDRPLSIRRRDGVPFSSPPSRLLYLVYPQGELQVIFYPFSQVVDAPFLETVATLIRDHCSALAPLLALYHIAHTCVEHGVFVELSEAFSTNAVTRATPSQQLALASPSWHVPPSAPGSGGPSWRATSGRAVVVADQRSRRACCWRWIISSHDHWEAPIRWRISRPFARSATSGKVIGTALTYGMTATAPLLRSPLHANHPAPGRLRRPIEQGLDEDFWPEA